MTFKTRFTDGETTVGEARSLVGIMTGATNPTAVEAYLVVSFNHVNSEIHELVIVSDRGREREQIDAILYMAHRATMAEIRQMDEPRNRFDYWVRAAVSRLGGYDYLWSDKPMA